MAIKVKALNLFNDERLAIVSENKEIAANIILNELCEFVEINNNIAYYNSEFSFNISEDISEDILTVAAAKIGKEIKGVAICCYFEEGLYEVKRFN